MADACRPVGDAVPLVGLGRNARSAGRRREGFGSLGWGQPARRRPAWTSGITTGAGKPICSWPVRSETNGAVPVGHAGSAGRVKMAGPDAGAGVPPVPWSAPGGLGQRHQLLRRRSRNHALTVSTLGTLARRQAASAFHRIVAVARMTSGLMGVPMWPSASSAHRARTAPQLAADGAAAPERFSRCSSGRRPATARSRAGMSVVPPGMYGTSGEGAWREALRPCRVAGAHAPRRRAGGAASPPVGTGADAIAQGHRAGRVLAGWRDALASSGSSSGATPRPALRGRRSRLVDAPVEQDDGRRDRGSTETWQPARRRPRGDLGSILLQVIAGAEHLVERGDSKARWCKVRSSPDDGAPPISANGDDRHCSA